MPLRQTKTSCFIARGAYLLLLLIAVSITGCARPTGDFGRAERRTNIIHDWILPFAGTLRTSAQDQRLLSELNYTHVDKQLRKASYVLVIPPHHGDWLGAIKVELERTRLLRLHSTKRLKTAYHDQLRSPKHGTSHARWNLLLDHVLSENNLLMSFQAAALTAVEQDRLRLAARSTLGQQNAWDQRHVMGRIQENDEIITWALSSAWQRYDAYSYSAERLKFEEPLLDSSVSESVQFALKSLHHELKEADAVLNTQISSDAVYK